jgi:hypothetical protein
MALGKCPRCRSEVKSISLYGDRTRQDVTNNLIEEGVPDGGRFTLEPCGDIIEAAQIQLRKTEGTVGIVFIDG